MPTIGVFAAIFDSAGRILLVRRAYPPYGWTTPGGRMEECESIAAAAAREVLEETGLTIQPGGVIGVYSAPFKNDVVIFVAAEVTGRGAWSPNGEIDCQAYFCAGRAARASQGPHARPHPRRLRGKNRRDAGV